MSEIYWITRLDGINTALNIFTVVGWILCGIFLISYLSTLNDKREEVNHKTSNKMMKKIFIPTVILTVLFLFTPTQKDMLLIYGVGGTIGYIKTNETAKQLPDKCVQALDQLIDEYIQNDETE